MRTRLLALAATLPLLAGTQAILTAGPAAAGIVAGPAGASGPCGTLASPPSYAHVIWVWLENHSYGTIIGSARAPYLNSLAAGCGLAVFITWDEGHGGTAGEKCATNKTDQSCHVATIVASPSTQPGTRPATLFNHYSLLRTAEHLLGLPLLGRAAAYPSMAPAFGL